MKAHARATIAAVVLAFTAAVSVSAQQVESDFETSPAPSAYEYRVLATNRTGTMQKELNEAAADGFRFLGVMKGETAFGGSEVLSVLGRTPGVARGRFDYKLLATLKTSTMQKELQEAGDAGF